MDSNNKDVVAIHIGSETKGPYNCNLDNIKLHLQSKETGEYICPRCSTSYFPNLGEKVKRANKFETPEGRDKMPMLSLVDDNINTEASSVYNQPKIPRSFENILKRPGVRMLDYTTSEDEQYGPYF